MSNKLAEVDIAGAVRIVECHDSSLEITQEFFEIQRFSQQLSLNDLRLATVPTSFLRLNYIIRRNQCHEIFSPSAILSTLMDVARASSTILYLEVGLAWSRLLDIGTVLVNFLSR